MSTFEPVDLEWMDEGVEDLAGWVDACERAVDGVEVERADDTTEGGEH